MLLVGEPEGAPSVPIDAQIGITTPGESYPGDAAAARVSSGHHSITTGVDTAAQGPAERLSATHFSERLSAVLLHGGSEPVSSAAPALLAAVSNGELVLAAAAVSAVWAGADLLGKLALCPRGINKSAALAYLLLHLLLPSALLGEFDFVQAKTDHGVLVRVYAPPGRLAEAVGSRQHVNVHVYIYI